MSGGPAGFTPHHPTGLAGCATAPCETFDVALLDLDGVLYVGDDAVPHAADALAEARRRGMRRTFVTNNASRTPAQTAHKIASVGVPAEAAEVVTSGQAAAHVLRDRLGAGATVLVTGTAALATAVTDAGLRVVASADDEPAGMVLGMDPTLDYPRLAEGALAVRRGALFVAANADATIPSARGLLPGMGALVALVVTATGKRPVVAGKPEIALHHESIARSHARYPLVVGDRLDTDIEGARTGGAPSLLVLTGVSTVDDLLAAQPGQRPDLVAPDLRGLLVAHPPATDGCCGEARAAWADGRIRVSGPDAGDRLRAALSAAWAARDAGRPVHGVDGL